MEKKKDFKPFKNIIKDKKAKEDVGNTIIDYLVNEKLIDLKKDLNHLKIEFGYLLLTHDNKITTLVKVQTAKKTFETIKNILYSNSTRQINAYE